MNFDLGNTNLIFMLLGAVVAILGLGLSVYGISTWLNKNNKISTRLDQFVAPEVQSASSAAESQIIPREISGSLFSRTVISWFKNLIYFLGRYTPEKMAIEMEHKLLIAGNPGKFHARDFFALRILVFLAGVILAFMLNRDLKNINMTFVLFGMVVIVICLLLPNVWLNGQVRSRQDELSRGLPDALDTLSVCASAGLGFDQSLQKISVYWDTELGHEFKRVTQEMEMGVSRIVALKNMSNRLDVDDISQFISIIVQAEKTGMNYAEVLQSQALQMRVLRRFRAREYANKLPAKMILPIALLIFPAMMAVILGPAIPMLLAFLK